VSLSQNIREDITGIYILLAITTLLVIGFYTIESLINSGQGLYDAMAPERQQIEIKHPDLEIDFYKPTLGRLIKSNVAIFRMECAILFSFICVVVGLMLQIFIQKGISAGLILGTRRIIAVHSLVVISYGAFAIWAILLRAS
jgi:hypothetical protein